MVWKCVICHENVVLKRYNIVRHYMAKHKLFNNTFPNGSSLRCEKLNFLKKSLRQQQKVTFIAAISKKIQQWQEHHVKFVTSLVNI